MKDKILSFAGMGIKRRSSSDPLITHLSPTNHPLLQKAWKYTTCMILALLLGVGNMWAADPQDTYYSFSAAVSANGSVVPVSGENNPITIGSSGSVAASAYTFAGKAYSYGLKLGNSKAKGATLSINGSEENPAHVFFICSASNKEIYLEFNGTKVATGKAYSSVTTAPGVIELVTTKDGAHELYGNGDIFCYRIIVLYEKNANVVKTYLSGADMAITDALNWDEDMEELLFFKPMEVTVDATNKKLTFPGTATAPNRRTITFTAQANGSLTIGIICTSTSNRNLMLKELKNGSFGEALVTTSNIKNGATTTLSYTSIEKGKTYVIVASGADISPTSIEFKADAAKHRVVYDLNDGTGTIPTQEDVAEGSTFIVASGTSGITAPEGKEFGGWSDGVNTYSGGVSYTMGTSDVTLTAQWRDPLPKFAVSYVLNGGDGVAPTETDKAAGDAFTLATAASRTGYRFAGWKCSVDGVVYAAENSYTMTASVTSFTAQWNLVAEQVLYSWESPEGTAIEVGGTATHYSGDTPDGSNTRVNYPQGSYYTISLNGSKDDYTGDHIRIALDENIKAGDKVKLTAYCTKDAAAAALMSTQDGTLIFNGNNVNNGTPTLQTYVVPTGINTNAIKMTRHQSGTNTFITKLEIVREKEIAEEDVCIVTFEVNGGSEVAAIPVEKGTPVTQPANPTKEHARFNGWKLGGSAYNFSTPVTANITLVADWTQLYTISFVAGEGGSGDAPAAIADKAEGETFTVPANTFTAPAGKEFDKWNDGSADYAPDATYTVGTANVVLTAIWKAETAKYTVIFKDGDDVLDTKLVEVGQKPTDAGIDKTKSLSTFAAWQKEGVDIALDDASWTSFVKDDEVILTARWNKVYATSVNLKDAATGSEAYGDVLDAHNIAYELTNTTWDEGTDIYNGLKIKGVNSYITFNLKQGQFLILTVGYATNDVRIDVDGVNQSFVSSTTALSTFNYYAESADAVIKVTKTATNGTASSIRDIFISDPYVVTYDAEMNGGDAVAPATFTGTALVLPAAAKTGENFLGWFDAATEGTKIGEAGDEYTPAGTVTLFAQFEAVSTDARLSAITFSSDAGTLVPTFDPEVTEYTYTMPYGTASIPTITGATAVNDNAQTPIIGNAAAAWGGSQTITGVAQSGAEKTYTITMQVAPKDGVCIIKATLSGASGKAATCTVTGLIGGTASVNLSNMKSDGGAKLDNSKSFGITLAEGTFQEGDVVNVHITTAAGQGTFAVWADDACTSLITDAGVVGVVGDNKLTLSSAANGKSTIYLARADAVNSWNPQLNVFEVYRAMNPMLKTLSINGKDADVSTTAVSMELATETDLDGLAIVETYISNDNSQVTTAVISNSGNWVEGENTYRVTDKDGDYTDYTITITLVTPAAAPAIETDLAASGTYEEYSSATLSIVASTTDGGTLTYQWYKDNVAIEGAESASYEVSEEGTYKVVVKNSLSATNYATATSTACVMTEVMPSGCDELASIPSAEPYQYVQTGEWTLYSITSGGKLNTTNKFKNNAKNFAGADVNAISDQRFAMKFDKNVEHVDFYATASSTRTWNGSKAIQVTEDDIAGSTVAYTDVTANFTTDLTTLVATGTRQYIFRATGIFEAGKTYWFAFNGGLDVFRICYAEALEKPVLPTLSDEDICEGGSFSEMSVASASVSEGTLSYQWYKDDEAIVGSEAATYQPTSAGTYYVVVTNSLLGRQPISAESNHAVLTASTSAVITTAPQNVRDDAGKLATLTVVAVGKNLHYAWKECATIDGTYTDVAGAADAASLEVTVPEGVKYYKVVVSSDCGGDVEAIVKVEEWVELSQVSVSESTVWDWANAGENNKLVSGKNVEILMANIRENDKTPTNDATFNSQALLFYGENVRAVEGGRAYASIGHISFTTTVPGVVTVEFSDNGNNNRRLSINGKLSESSTGKTDVKTFKAYVPAGEVVLMGVASDGTGTNQYIRISKIEFTKVDYSRDVTTGRLGTICLPNGGKMYGADLYEVAYFDASAKKIFFDEILSGEMEAGMPYVFLPNGTLDKLAVSYTDEANASAGHKNGLYGSYTQEVLGTDGSNYILLNNQYCRVVEENTYVGAYRAYIKLNEIGTTSYSPAPGRRRISMGVQSEQVATGIGDVQGDEVQSSKVLINGQLFILRGEKMYDATGRLVK